MGPPGDILKESECLNSVLTVKAAEGPFKQEKALVGAFSMIVKTDGLYAALVFVDTSRFQDLPILPTT